MKAKKKKAALAVAIAAAVLMITLSVFIRPVSLIGVQTAQVDFEYGDVSVHTQLSDEDAKRLAQICRGVAVNDFTAPACGFGTVEIKFENSLFSTALFPACDCCGTMMVSNHSYYSIGSDERAELEKILAEYGVTFPCV